MPASPFFGRVVAGLLLLATPLLRAHGDDQLLIDALTEELAKAPEADLFIRRDELIRHLKEWSRAEADYAAAERLTPQPTSLDFFRAALPIAVTGSGPSASHPLVQIVTP